MPTVDFWQIPGKQTSDYESTHQMELFGTHLATSNYSARSMMSSCMAKIKVNITAGSLRHWRGYRQRESHWTPTSVTEETKLASMLIRTRPRWSPRCHLCHSHQAEASQDVVNKLGLLSNFGLFGVELVPGSPSPYTYSFIGNLLCIAVGNFSLCVHSLLWTRMWSID